MKLKKIVSLLLILLFFNIVKSQETEKKVKAGFKAGLNIANIAGTPSKPRLNFHAGIVMEIFISNKFSLQPELLFSKQGYESDFNQLLVKSSYVNFPLMSHLKLSDAIGFQIGPQFGYNTKTTFEIDDTEVEGTDLRKFDFGAASGFQFSLSKAIFLQARYVIGINKIRKTGNLRNSVISLSLGFKL